MCERYARPGPDSQVVSLRYWVGVYRLGAQWIRDETSVRNWCLQLYTGMINRDANRPATSRDECDDERGLVIASVRCRDYAYAAPTRILRMRRYGDPCEMLLVCVGWPLASPPVPCISHDSLPEIASRLPQKSVVIAL